MHIQKDIFVDLVVSTNDEVPFLFGFNIKFKIGRVLINDNFEKSQQKEILLLSETPDSAKSYIINKVKKYFKYHPYINEKINYLINKLHYHEEDFEIIIKKAYELNKNNEILPVYLCLHC